MVTFNLVHDFDIYLSKPGVNITLIANRHIVNIFDFVSYVKMKGNVTDMVAGGLQERLSCPPLLVNLRPHCERWRPYCFSYLTTQQVEGFHLLPLTQPSQ